jgi:hypothetical protein
MFETIKDSTYVYTFKSYLIMKLFRKVYIFYYEGFKGMSKTGRTLWLIIFVKLLIMFAILKMFFFPDILKTKYSTDKERADYVIDNLTSIK